MDAVDLVSPNESDATQLRTNINGKILGSIGYLSELARDDADQTDDGIELVAEDKISGFLHIHYHDCVSHLKSNEKAAALTCLSHINRSLKRTDRPHVSGLFASVDEQYNHDAYMRVSNKSFLSTYGAPLDASRLDGVSCQQSVDATNEALDWLKESDPTLYDELSIYVTDVLLVHSDTMNAASSVNSMGIVRMSHLKPGQNWTRYYENLVHEAAHQHLNYIWSEHELIENEDSGTYASPLRQEPRPLSGILHAAFVLARTMRGISMLNENGSYDPARHPISTAYNNKKNPASFREKFDDCIETLQKHAKFTDFGAELFSEMQVFADQYQT